MVIVYRSNTGFTRQYAEMLGKAEKQKVYELSQAEEALPQGAEVFFLGPLMAGHITGVDQAVRRFTVRGVCGVGMMPPGRQALAALEKSNYVPNAPMFYLQGGWAPKKVGWLKRRMVGMATRSMRQSLGSKGGRRTPEEQAQYNLLVKGGSMVAFEKLETIRSWMQEQQRPGR